MDRLQLLFQSLGQSQGRSQNESPRTPEKMKSLFHGFLRNVLNGIPLDVKQALHLVQVVNNEGLEKLACLLDIKRILELDDFWYEFADQQSTPPSPAVNYGMEIVVLWDCIEEKGRGYNMKVNDQKLSIGKIRAYLKVKEAEVNLYVQSEAIKRAIVDYLDKMSSDQGNYFYNLVNEFGRYIVLDVIKDKDVMIPALKFVMNLSENWLSRNESHSMVQPDQRPLLPQ